MSFRIFCKATATQLVYTVSIFISRAFSSKLSLKKKQDEQRLQANGGIEHNSTLYTHLRYLMTTGIEITTLRQNINVSLRF